MSGRIGSVRLVFEARAVHRGGTHAELVDAVHVDVDADVRVELAPSLLDHFGDVLEVRLLEPALDDARGRLLVRVSQRRRDDGRRDDLGGVDDLLDARDTKRDAHSGDTGEMEAGRRSGRGRSEALAACSSLGAHGTVIDERLESLLAGEQRQRDQLLPVCL
jgi:hypothetical protein